jgi:hypothetical protein
MLFSIWAAWWHKNWRSLATSGARRLFPARVHLRSSGAFRIDSSYLSIQKYAVLLGMLSSASVSLRVVPPCTTSASMGDS